MELVCHWHPVVDHRWGESSGFRTRGLGERRDQQPRQRLKCVRQRRLRQHSERLECSRQRRIDEYRKRRHSLRERRPWQYGERHVKYVRNITDIDDKINNRARERGIDIATLTRDTTRLFHEDVAELGCLTPDVEPTATGHVEEMKSMIKTLIDKGYAYFEQSHVLFNVPAMMEKPPLPKHVYGLLSKKNRDDLIAGARIDVAPYKKDPADFVLWKPSTTEQPGWQSPWGRGRPGWHIECSAMSLQHLGETFDIHAGGLDLIFPHHENEIAQSRSAFGTTFMAKYWMHNGFITANGEKMAKSLGNFFTVRELLEEFPGEAIRLLLLTAQEVHQWIGITARKVVVRVFGVLLAALAVQSIFNGLGAAHIFG